MRIVNSVSAGLSSVMMAIMMKEWYPDAEIINIMANTGKEREESLVFMHQCDMHYGLNLVWVEADINPEKRKGTGFTIKNFKSLNRNGSIFEKGIQKYGIPSVVNKWCNRELKLQPIHKYIESIGWGKFGVDYYTSIGIRIDEIDRISEKRKEFKILYPLFERGITKSSRNKFWSNQPIHISISGYEGNCDMCFEKTIRKLATIYKDNPNLIDWWKHMEYKYSDIKLEGKPNYNKFIEQEGGHYSLRNNQSYDNVVKASKTKFSRATDEYFYETDLFDKGGSCDQGCNIFESILK